LVSSLKLRPYVSELISVYFVEPGGGTGVVTEQLVDWFQRNASSIILGPDALPTRLRALIAAIADAGAKPEVGRCRLTPG
jgi:hypothetical protein